MAEETKTPEPTNPAEPPAAEQPEMLVIGKYFVSYMGPGEPRPPADALAWIRAKVDAPDDMLAKLCILQGAPQWSAERGAYACLWQAQRPDTRESLQHDALERKALLEAASR